jgi:hypothetical protein
MKKNLLTGAAIIVVLAWLFAPIWWGLENMEEAVKSIQAWPITLQVSLLLLPFFGLCLWVAYRPLTAEQGQVMRQTLESNDKPFD